MPENIRKSLIAIKFPLVEQVEEDTLGWQGVFADDFRAAVRNERISLCADRHDDSDRSVETWKR